MEHLNTNYSCVCFIKCEIRKNVFAMFEWINCQMNVLNFVKNLFQCIPKYILDTLKLTEMFIPGISLILNIILVFSIYIIWLKITFSEYRNFKRILYDLATVYFISESHKQKYSNSSTASISNKIHNLIYANINMKWRVNRRQFF